MDMMGGKRKSSRVNVICQRLSSLFKRCSNENFFPIKKTTLIRGNTHFEKEVDFESFVPSRLSFQLTLAL